MELHLKNDSGTERLLSRAGRGDREALGELLSRHRERLRRMVELRLDRRLQGRLEASDVLQDAYLEATRRIDDYLRNPKMSFFLWLRFITQQRLITLHQHHLGVKKRDPRREVPLGGPGYSGATSAALAARLLGRQTSPSQAAMRAERKARLLEVLERMEPIDREVLALRHLEQLSNAETAQVLGIEPSAASKRYLRAAKLLRDLLSGNSSAWE